MERDDYIHEWFELSYANYLALPRSVIQQMPPKWQKQFVELMDELDDTFEWRREGCFVKFKDNNGNFMQDTLNDYRYTSYSPEDIKKITDKHNENFNKE